MSDKIVYTILENGVHHVKWLNVGRDAIYEFVERLVEEMGAIKEREVFRILHDYSDTETPSFTMMTTAMKSFKVPNTVKLRVAHIYSDMSYPMIVKNATLVSGLNANRKFFQAGEEKQAMDWLLEK